MKAAAACRCPYCRFGLASLLPMEGPSRETRWRKPGATDSGDPEGGDTMDSTRRTIGLALFIIFAVVGSGWALEKAFINSYARGGAPVVEPAAAPVAREPSDTPAPKDVEYDRSDLLLMQG